MGKNGKTFLTAHLRIYFQKNKKLSKVTEKITDICNVSKDATF